MLQSSYKILRTQHMPSVVNRTTVGGVGWEALITSWLQVSAARIQVQMPTTHLWISQFALSQFSYQ